ncbi:MAG TPA: AMP-binding protein, partial [Egibacteraceae bacterium]|nr:AMP-binding protein [Egibacteraceae bacterium]
PAELAHPQQLEAGHSPGPLRVAAGTDDLAEIIYTSGTTGSPKGVACSHRSILVHDLPPEPQGGPVSFAHAFPIGTNAGQECLRMPLRRPATAVVLPSFDPERLCALIAGRRIQRLQLVPAMAQMIVTSQAATRHDVSSVERVTLSSAPTPPALLPRLSAAFPNASLWNAYALTESGSARTVMRYDPSRPGSVGRPVGKSEVRVVDDAGDDLPPGEAGEVWLRRTGSPRRGYYRDPAATAAAFAGDWLRTGDLGFLDEDGYLYLVDRKKDLIISGGLNISSVEVENALYEHPAVLEAAVFGVAHDVLGQDVAAAVVVGSATETRELQSFVRQRLGEHKVPRQVAFVDRLPRNEAGKVLKRELRERFAAQPSSGAPALPSGDVEPAVVAGWQAVLGREDVGIHDDFFALGGHSLAAAQVVARLQDAFEVDLPVTAVFERPTVAELAAAVGDALTEARH